MAKLIYIANVSLDGYIEDSHGNFDWTTPNDEVFAFITDLVRSSGTYLYGRRMYETMAVWETDPALAAAAPWFLGKGDAQEVRVHGPRLLDARGERYVVVVVARQRRARGIIGIFNHGCHGVGRAHCPKYLSSV